MREVDLFDEESGATVFRDVILLALAGFVTVVMLLLPHINPKATAEKGSRSPGNVIIEIRWPDDIDADVDLWVEAPGDVPVGYSNKGAHLQFVARRPGSTMDVTDLNYEFSYSRGIPAGDYTVNVHLFRNKVHAAAFPVTVAVSVKKSTDDAAMQILTTKLNMAREGEELTAFRFKLDDAGRLIRGSVHDLPRALRSKAQT